jgi:hypothetical protein
MLQTAAFARVPAWTFLPHFPGALQSGCCWFQSEWLGLWEGTQWRKSGTRKAQDAKLPVAEK